MRNVEEITAEIFYKVLNYTGNAPGYIAVKYSYSTGKFHLELRKEPDGNSIPPESYQFFFNPWGPVKSGIIACCKELCEMFMRKDGEKLHKGEKGIYPLLDLSLNVRSCEAECYMTYRKKKQSRSERSLSSIHAGDQPV